MQITGIQDWNKRRCKIELDGEYAFTLYKGELRTYGIYEGGELSASAFQSIMTEVLPKRAKLRAMALLKEKPYTERQLSDKLKDGGYPEEIRRAAIDYVKSFHYVDDASYAKDYITQQMDTRSRMRIEQDLQKRGIRKEIIQAAFDELADDGACQDETEMIRRFLQQKHYDPETATRQDQQKLMAALYRKGFSIDKIKRCFHYTDD